MNKGCVAGSLLLIAAPLMAEGPFPRKEHRVYPADEDILEVNRSVSGSYQFSQLYYIEPSANTGIPTGTDYLDNEEGGLNGGKLAFSWMTLQDQWYFHGEWAGNEGQIPYTGYFYTEASPGGPVTILGPANLTSRATTQDFDFKFGKGLNLREHWMLTPYLSLGGRHWTRVLGLGTQADYNETYQHYYFAFGSLLQYEWRGLVITGDAAIGGTFLPTMTDSPDGFSHEALGTAPIIKLGVELDRRIWRNIHFFDSFDYMAYSYGASGNVPVPGAPQGYYVFEPASNTQTYNFNFGLRYSFGGKTS